MGVMLAETREAKQTAFLEYLAQTGSVTQAATLAGISRDAPYTWLDAERRRGIDVDSDSPEDGSFARGCLLAKKQAAESILGQVHQQALSDDKSMPTAIQRMFVVKRWFPEYRDQINVRHSGAVLQGRVDLNQLDPHERRELLGLVSRRLQLAAGSGEENVALGAEAAE